MQGNAIHIASTGSHLPGQPVDNARLEELFGIRAEWIDAALGIQSRHLGIDIETRSAFTTTAEMGAKAGLHALDRAQMRPEDVDLLILTTNSPDRLTPATVTYTQEHLGIQSCTALQLHGGCSTPIQGLITALQFLQTGMVETALIVGSEMLSVYSNFDGNLNAMDRVNTALFGDGAGALLLTTRPVGTPARILATHCTSLGTGRPAGLSSVPLADMMLKGKRIGFEHNYKAVRKEGPQFMVDGVHALLEKVGLPLDEVKLIPNQSSPHMISLIAELLEADRERIFVDCYRTGNTNAASALIAMDKAITSGWVQPGENAILISMCVSKWLYAGVGLAL